MKYEWEMVYNTKRGHKYFLDHITGKVSVCDESGNLPHLTDDGVLWLDQDRDITIQDHYHQTQLGMTAHTTVASIPITTEQGDASTTGANMEEAAKVAAYFSMTMRVGGVLCLPMLELPVA